MAEPPAGGRGCSGCLPKVISEGRWLQQPCVQRTTCAAASCCWLALTAYCRRRLAEKGVAEVGMESTDVDGRSKLPLRCRRDFSSLCVVA